MHCIYCQAQDTKVIDSRLVNDRSQVRRRRECLQCQGRFTTYETVEMSLPRVVKRDRSMVAFDEDKLRRGLLTALEKRPVSTETIDTTIYHIIHTLRSSGEREISSQRIGELVMSALQDIDHIAYVRFASVYRSFEDVSQFQAEIARLKEGNE